ncbi:hypothetical protein [Ferruginibacter albus]|uniref:hypothetical protein n=1 Tax=Ferruginibacter albus TaxID=2875540 RepID=UPI001CC590F2|nr:hypothetical protein [Ferruginibacter albus]UAY52607.1 hypothetical protein K9M53_02690 [Ferruginibacter albus]
MKKYLSKIIAMLFIAIAFSFTASAQFVRERPTHTIVVRTAPPSPRHVWVDEDWAWRGGNYVYTGGYWAEPKPGLVWVAGHWKHRRHGWYWVPGRWR